MIDKEKKKRKEKKKKKEKKKEKNSKGMLFRKNKKSAYQDV